MSMEAKDFIAIVISLVALLFSIGATVFSLRKKKYEDRRIARNVLGETLGKITSARVDQARFASENKDSLDNIHVQNVFNSIDFQKNALVRLAVYITDEFPDIATDIEYGIIADSFAASGDRVQGARYWQIAIDKSLGQHFEVYNRRAFGLYLFGDGNVGDGRAQFKKAIELCPPNNDILKYDNGKTHIMLALCERAVGNTKTANESFALAEEAFSTISIENARVHALKELEGARLPRADLHGHLKPGTEHLLRPPPFPDTVARNS
jgi:hypothetical protein